MKTILFCITVLLFTVLVFSGCERTAPDMTVPVCTDNYTNPIDRYFLPKIESSLSEAERREYQDTYRGVWKEEFLNVIKWLDSKCVYKDDRKNVWLIEKNIEDFINEYYYICLFTQNNNAKLEPEKRISLGTGFRSGFNQSIGEVYRDACMRLITDDYAFLNRDYSEDHFE